MPAHDTLAKDVLEVLLDDLGTFVRECEIPAPASQRADAYFAPHASALSALQELGTLGRMCLQPGLFDPFYDPPTPEDVSESLRKFLNHRHGARSAPAERLWLPCAGRPDEALRRFAFSPSAGWPAGFYTLSEALPVTVVVLPELDDSVDTVALRLMGRREPLNRALRTLRRRTADIPRGRRLFVAVVQWINTWRGRGLRWEEDAMLDLTETEAFLERQFAAGMQQGMRQGMRQGMQEGMQQGMRQGMQEGMQQGQLSLLTRLFERRLARPLTASECARLAERLRALGVDALTDAALTDAPDALAEILRDDGGPRRT